MLRYSSRIKDLSTCPFREKGGAVIFIGCQLLEMMMMIAVRCARTMQPRRKPLAVPSLPRFIVSTMNPWGVWLGLFVRDGWSLNLLFKCLSDGRDLAGYLICEGAARAKKVTMCQVATRAKTHSKRSLVNHGGGGGWHTDWFLRDASAPLIEILMFWHHHGQVVKAKDGTTETKDPFVGFWFY